MSSPPGVIKEEKMVNAEQVKSLAASLGFDACGITGAGPLPEAEERLKLWLREGAHGEMKYLENFETRAKNFWKNFPQAKSIIVVGVNYYSNAALPVGAPPCGCPESNSMQHRRTGTCLAPACPLPAGQAGAGRGRQAGVRPYI